MRKRPCSRRYASISVTFSSLRPVCRRYTSDCSSTGKNPMVAPYSGAMLAMVARSARVRFAHPAPKNSIRCDNLE